MLLNLVCAVNIADEDFETAVKALNGKLYRDPPEREAVSAGSGKFHGQSSYRDGYE